MSTITTVVIVITGLAGLVVGWQNVALSANGATCKASSAFSHRRCQRAINGLLWGDQDWAAVNQGVGIWIQVNFRQTYTLTYGRVMQRFYHGEQNKMIKLTFDGNQSVEEYLTKRTGQGWNTYYGQHWDEFSLDHIKTSFVRIEVMEVYSTLNNGFNEVEFYTGINPCDMFYTYVDGKCYSYSCHTTLTWENARQMCQDEGGDLTYFETEAEMITVFYWLKKSLNFETKLWVGNSNLTFSNGTLTYHPSRGVNRIVLMTPAGTLGYALGNLSLMYICEAEPAYDEWRYVPSTGDRDPIVPAALTERETGVNKGPFVGVLAVFAIAVVVLVVIIVIGRHHYRDKIRKLGRGRSGSQDTLSSHL